MTTETLIEKVRAKLGTLDAQSEQLLATALEIIQNANAPSKPLSQENFVSRNITLEEYRALPREAKWRYQDQAAKLNRRWIDNQFNRLKAKWMMVVSGQVVRHGATLDNYPEDEEFLALCQETGKYPFVFTSTRAFAIEELWHNSPFTAINPTRTFLLGRSALFNLRPRITLDFDTLVTEVRYGETAT